MADRMEKPQRKRSQNQSHMPEDSIFYEKVVPALFIGLGILTAVLILVAAGIAVGIIPY